MSYVKRCPVGCNAEFSPSDFQTRDGRLLRCSCGQMVSPCNEARYWESMSEFNDPHGTTPANRERFVRRSRRILDRLHPGHLLDVGCSSGAFLSVARDVGFITTGVEPAEKAARTAQGLGLDVFIGTLEQAGFADQSFDVITLFEVIEHLKEPIPLLQEAFRVLVPGGTMLIGTGNVDSWTAKIKRGAWGYLDINHHGGHISFFTPESISQIARHTGFVVDQIETRGVDLGSRLLSELAALPAKLAGKGHTMLVWLKKP